MIISGKRAVIGYQDGAIKVWDLKSGSVLQSITGNINIQKSKCYVLFSYLNVNTCVCNPLLYVIVKTVQTVAHVCQCIMSPIWYFAHPKTLNFTCLGHSGHANSITIIDCHTDNTLILTGSADVTTKLISTSTGKVGECFIRWNLQIMQ